MKWYKNYLERKLKEIYSCARCLVEIVIFTELHVFESYNEEVVFANIDDYF